MAFGWFRRHFSTDFFHVLLFFILYLLHIFVCIKNEYADECGSFFCFYLIYIFK